MARTTGSTTRHYTVQNARQRTWNAMRVLKRFTTAAIEDSADINERNLRAYLHALHHAGYLHQDQPKRNGKAMGHVLWRLVRYTGPNAPIVRRGGEGVYDPNHDCLYPYAETPTSSNPAPKPSPAAEACHARNISKQRLD